MEKNKKLIQKSELKIKHEEFLRINDVQREIIPALTVEKLQDPEIDYEEGQIIPFEPDTPIIKPLKNKKAIKQSNKLEVKKSSFTPIKSKIKVKRAFNKKSK